MIDIDRILHNDSIASIAAEAWCERTAALSFLLPADEAEYRSLLDCYARWILDQGDDALEEFRYSVLRAATLLVAFVTASEAADVETLARRHTTCTSAADVTRMILFKLHGGRPFRYSAGGSCCLREAFAIHIGVQADSVFKACLERADYLDDSC